MARGGLEGRLIMAGFPSGVPNVPRTWESERDYALRVRPLVDCFDAGDRVEVMGELLDISNDYRMDWAGYCESTRHSPRRFINEDVSDIGLASASHHTALVKRYERRVRRLVSRYIDRAPREDTHERLHPPGA